MTPEKIIEALVFVSENPLKPAQIAELFKSSEFEGMEMTEEMAKEILDGLVVEIGPDLAGAAGVEIDAEVVSYDPRRGVAYGQRLPPAVLRERMAIVKKG